MSKSIEERFEESFKYGGNSQYLEQLYEDYIEDPAKLTPEWRKYFDSIQNGQTDISHNSVQEGFKNLKLKSVTKTNTTKTIPKNSKSSDVQNLINACCNSVFVEMMFFNSLFLTKNRLFRQKMIKNCSKT